ncbi:MAG: protein-L-isoaspartate(D-aspartate) O-methyltransferase [Bacillota bacterium]
MMNRGYDWLRENMVETQLKPRGITDEKVLEVFYKVPRHLFVSESQRPLAYEDHPLPIALDQTISQPFIVALMTQCLELKGNEKILEIGTGSGYQTAILAELANHVYTIERFEDLSRKAEAILTELGYNNVSYKVGDGSKGWPEKSPFEGIMVTAAAGNPPKTLLDQLACNGKMVIPVGDHHGQELVVFVKDAEGNLYEHKKGGCRFLPLVGNY